MNEVRSGKRATRLSPLVRLLLGILAVLVPVVLGQLLITALPISKFWQNVLLGIATPPVAVSAYAAFVRLTERRGIPELGQDHAWRELGLGVAFGALLFGAVMAVLAALGNLSVAGTNSWSVMIVPFIGALTSGVFEEILFRGVVFRLLEEALGSWLGLTVSALIFGGLHLLNDNATLVGALAVMLEAGVLLAACYMLTRRLWLPIGVHFAWNFVQAGVFGQVVSGGTARAGLLRASLAGPEWLTGGQFGPEASAVAVAFGLVLGALLLIKTAAKGNLLPVPWSKPPAS